MDAPETNPKLGKMVLEVVRNQIRDNDPPETRQTFERLKGEGHAAHEAHQLISTAVTVELFHIMRDHQEFDRERFVWNLAHLPREPWDKDGKEFYEG
jgi:hypothetical protein